MKSKTVRPRVLIVGGGYGGVALAKLLDQDHDADVVLIERKDAFEHNVATLRAIARPEWVQRVFIPYDRLLRHGRFLRERAVRVDASTVVLQSGEELHGDFVVLATGSSYEFPVKSDVDDRAIAEGNYVRVHEELAAAARVLLLGAGPVGLELAGEILDRWPGKRVTLVDRAPEILPEHSSELRREIRRQLDLLGVRLLTGTTLAGEPGTPPGVARSFTVTARKSSHESASTPPLADVDDAFEIGADIWFRCYGATPVTDYLAGDLAAARTADGHIKVTPALLVEGQRSVFALGDITSIPESKRARAAGLHAEVVAANIMALAAGERELTTYCPAAPAIVLPLGPKGGATEAPSLGVVGPEQTSRFKGADLNVSRFLELLGYGKDTTQRTDRNKAVVRTIYERCLNEGEMNLLEELVAPDFIGVHDDRGVEGFTATLTGLRTAFPDIRYEIEELFAEGDRVVLRFRWTATHASTFRGFAPTATKVSETGIAIYRLRDGKVVRTWLETNRLGFLLQIGALPPGLTAKLRAQLADA